MTPATLPPDSPAILSRAGLAFHRPPTVEEWEEIGRQLAPIARTIGFVVGDWINAGKGFDPARYARAVDATGLDYATLRDYASVAASVEMSLRNDILSFTHYRALAKLPVPEQRHWVDTVVQANASGDPVSYRRLRTSIRHQRLLSRAEEAELPVAPPRLHTPASVVRAMRAWWTPLETEGWLDRATAHEVEAVLADLDAAAIVFDALYDALEAKQAKEAKRAATTHDAAQKQAA